MIRLRAALSLLLVLLTAVPALAADVRPSTRIIANPVLSGTITGTPAWASTQAMSISGNAATVTTNANLTGPITSSGNATAIASQTGTGTKFVVDTSPTLVTPNIGAATAGGTLAMGSNAITSTGAIGGASHTITAAPNTVPLTIGGYSLTGSDASSLVAASGTWNTSGNVTLLDYNITQTASGSSSLLFNFRDGATHYLKLSKAGTLTVFNSVDVGTVIKSGGVAPEMDLSTSATASGNGFNFFNASAYTPSTTVNQTAMRVFSQFQPSANAPNFAGLAIEPTINGASTGKAYGLIVATTTNTLTGGTIKLLSVGTTTSSWNTSYTPMFDIGTTGVITAAGLKTTGSATGKTIVCVDTTTGILYASTSGDTCAN